MRDLTQQCNDFANLDQWVREIESDGKGLPVLLKQYQGMGAKILGFNYDPNFNYTLDCLALTYLKDIPPRKMEFYMGKENFHTYRNSQI